MGNSRWTLGKIYPQKEWSGIGTGVPRRWGGGGSPSLGDFQEEGRGGDGLTVGPDDLSVLL